MLTHTWYIAFSGAILAKFNAIFLPTWKQRGTAGGLHTVFHISGVLAPRRNYSFRDEF